MDVRAAYGDASSSDVILVVERTTFNLHKFPLTAKSAMFNELFASKAAPSPVVIESFPGGASCFEALSRYCYGFDLVFDTTSIAELFAGCRFLRMADLERKTEAYLVSHVLRVPQKAVVVLASAAQLVYESEAVMVDLVGRCINAVAAGFEPFPEVVELPPDCFSCVVRTARSMEVQKSILESAVLNFLHSRLQDVGSVDESGAARSRSDSPADSGRHGTALGLTLDLSVPEFVEVVASPGRVENIRFAKEVFAVLEVLLAASLEASAVDDLCGRLSDLAFWSCLPHEAIERMYAERRVPDRYIVEALMSENRHILRLNDELATQVDNLTSALVEQGPPHVRAAIEA